MRDNYKALITLVILLTSVVFGPTSLIKVVQAQTITLHLVIDSEGMGAQSEIADLIEPELAKIGIEVVIDERDGTTIANTVWGEYWDKTWDEEPGKGWDMTWYEFPRPKAWAVICCASSGIQRHTPDAHYVYHVLTEHYNFDNESICYLSTEFLPGVDYYANENNFKWAINQWLASRSDNDDLIFIYIVGHGGGYNTIENTLMGGREDGSEGDPKDEGDEHFIDGAWVGVDECIHFQVGNSKYWDDELAADLDTLSYSRLIFVGAGEKESDEEDGGCYNGGLIDDISAPNRIIMTASNETYYCWADKDADGFSEWTESFMDALHGEDTSWDHTYDELVHEGVPIDADDNSDGHVSMLEAWQYAWDHDNARLEGIETPWLDDNGNREPTYKNGQDVNAPVNDGQLASETYLPALPVPEKDLEENLMNHYLANATPPNGGYNIMGCNSTDADTFLIGGMETLDVGARKAYFDAWQKEWMRDPPAVIIYYPSPHQCARGIAFNFHHPVLRNCYVRQAIARAIPYEDIFRDILPSVGIEDPKPGIAAVLPSHYYQGIQLWNTEIKPYTYNIAKAQRYLDMWLYAQTGSDHTKGCVGDANFDGIVDLDDRFLWGEEFGNAPYDIPYAPYTIDADFDNNGNTAGADYGLWLATVGNEYPCDGAGGSSSSSSPESPEEPPAMPTDSEGPYVKVYVDQPLGYIPGQPPHRTVSVDIIIEVTNITDGSAEGIVGWGMDVQVDPDVLSINGASGAASGYFLWEFADVAFLPPPTMLQGNKNSTTGYWDELAEIFVPLPPLGAGNGTSYPTSSNLLVTLEFTSKSKPKYSLIDLIDVAYLTPDRVWHPVNEIIDGHYNPPPT